MAFQHSKVLDVDDDTYPIISRYRDFSLERHETYPYSSEFVSESIQMKLCRFFFFFLDILFMRGLVVLNSVENTYCGERKYCVVASIVKKGPARRTTSTKKKKKISSGLTQTRT
jgi:hypothetical protein